MPEAITLEDRHELTKLLGENFKPSQFFRKMCATDLHKTKNLILQQEKQTRLIAPYVSDDDEDGKVIGRDGYERLVVTAPTLHPKRNLTRRDVEVAANAEQVFTYDNGGATPEKIQFQKLMKDALDLRQSIERREEQQIIEAMTTGKVEVIFDAGKRTINLNIPAGNLTAAAAGDKFDAENSNPITYLLAQKRLLAKNGGGRGFLCVMGSDAYEAFIQNKAVKEYMDNRRMNFGEIEPGEMDTDYVTRMAHILGMDIVTYDDFFYSESEKKDVEMYPKDKITIIGAGAGFKMHYGAIADGTDGSLNVCQSYAYTWIKDGKSKILEEESCPLFVPQVGGGIISRKVV